LFTSKFIPSDLLSEHFLVACTYVGQHIVIVTHQWGQAGDVLTSGFFFMTVHPASCIQSVFDFTAVLVISTGVQN